MKIISELLHSIIQAAFMLTAISVMFVSYYVSRDYFASQGIEAAAFLAWGVVGVVFLCFGGVYVAGPIWIARLARGRRSAPPDP